MRQETEEMSQEDTMWDGFPRKIWTVSVSDERMRGSNKWKKNNWPDSHMSQLIWPSNQQKKCGINTSSVALSVNANHSLQHFPYNDATKWNFCHFSSSLFIPKVLRQKKRRKATAEDVCAFLESSSTTSSRPLTTLRCCCRHVAACSTRCMCCAREAHRPRPCTTSSMPPSLCGLSMQRQRGLECAQLLTARVLTQCCVAASGSATVAMISRPLPTCSAPRTMSYSTASNRTLIMFCIRTSLATLTFPTNSVLVLIVWH